MRTIEDVVSELSSELIRFLNEPKDQRERVKANLDHLKCGRCLNEIVEIHKAEKEDVFDKIKTDNENEKCIWIKYDYRTICPRECGGESPYWRIPENMENLKYCPYCGKEIEVQE